MAYYTPTDWELKDFYREHVDSLYRGCCFLTCGEGDAQKMTEEILLSLLEKGMIFSSDKDARAWMILAAYKMSRRPPKPTPAEQPEDQVQAPVQVSSEDAKKDIPEEVEPDSHVQSDAPAAELAELPEEITERDSSGDVSEPVMTEENTPPDICEEKQAISAPQFPEEFRKLSRKDRLIALMYYCEGYRKAEIANYLGWPSFRVSTRLSRIKARILSEKGVVEAC